MNPTALVRLYCNGPFEHFSKFLDPELKISDLATAFATWVQITALLPEEVINQSYFMTFLRMLHIFPKSISEFDRPPLASSYGMWRAPEPENKQRADLHQLLGHEISKFDRELFFGKDGVFDARIRVAGSKISSRDNEDKYSLKEFVEKAFTFPVEDRARITELNFFGCGLSNADFAVLFAALTASSPLFPNLEFLNLSSNDICCGAFPDGSDVAAAAATVEAFTAEAAVGVLLQRGLTLDLQLNPIVEINSPLFTGAGAPPSVHARFLIWVPRFFHRSTGWTETLSVYNWSDADIAAARALHDTYYNSPRVTDTPIRCCGLWPTMPSVSWRLSTMKPALCEDGRFVLAVGTKQEWYYEVPAPFVLKRYIVRESVCGCVSLVSLVVSLVTSLRCRGVVYLSSVAWCSAMSSLPFFLSSSVRMYYLSLFFRLFFEVQFLKRVSIFVCVQTASRLTVEVIDADISPPATPSISLIAINDRLTATQLPRLEVSRALLAHSQRHCPPLCMLTGTLRQRRNASDSRLPLLLLEGRDGATVELHNVKKAGGGSDLHLCEWSSGDVWAAYGNRVITFGPCEPSLPFWCRGASAADAGPPGKAWMNGMVFEGRVGGK